MKKELIPKGVYCDGCPYDTRLHIFDKDDKPVIIPYCLYLKKGSLGGVFTEDNAYNKLNELFEYENEELYSSDNEITGLDLLWDGVKCCNINISNE